MECSEFRFFLILNIESEMSLYIIVNIFPMSLVLSWLSNMKFVQEVLWYYFTLIYTEKVELYHHIS